MRFVWASALKDLRRLRRDPAALAVWIGIPVFVLLILYVVFGRGSVMPQGRLLVADEDGSLLSGLLAGAFGQGPLGKMLVVERVKQDEGRRRMERGDGSALLIIPKGFGRAVLLNQPCQLKLITNPAQRILPGIVEETLSIVVEGAFYLQLVAGDELRVLAGGPPTDQTIADVSVRFNRLGNSLARYLDPLLIEVQTKVEEEKASVRTNFAAAFLPGMLLLAVLFVAQGLSGDFWKERTSGTLRRLVASPQPLSWFLGGKLLAAALVLLAVALAGLACARWVVNMDVNYWLPAALWITFTGVAMFLLLGLLQLYASSERAGNILSTLVMFPLIFLGGSFFPFEAMPETLAAIGRWTPNGWALVELRSMLAGSLDLTRMGAVFAGLAAVCLAAFLVVLRRLRRGFVL